MPTSLSIDNAIESEISYEATTSSNEKVMDNNELTTLPVAELFEVTAYTLNPRETGKRPGDRGYGITSSGTRVSEGRTVACAKSVPAGSTVTIPEVGATYVCEDTGAAITEGHVDIYMTSVDRARDFGRRKMDVIIDEKGAD